MRDLLLLAAGYSFLDRNEEGNDRDPGQWRIPGCSQPQLYRVSRLQCGCQAHADPYLHHKFNMGAFMEWNLLTLKFPIQDKMAVPESHHAMQQGFRVVVGGVCYTD